MSKPSLYSYARYGLLASLFFSIFACTVPPAIKDTQVDQAFIQAKIAAENRALSQKVGDLIEIEVTDSSTVTNGRVWLTIFNEPIADILPLLVDNVLYDNDVDPSTRSTLNVEDVALVDALEQLLTPVGLYYVRQNDGIVIKSQPKITFSAFKQPLYIVLNSMLAESNVNYVVEDGAGESLDDLINAQFVDLPLEQALSRVLSPIGLHWKREANGYSIYRDKEEIFHVNFPLLEQSFDIYSARIAPAVEGSKTTTTSAGLSKDGASQEVQGGIPASNSVARAFGTSGNLNGLDKTLEGFLSPTGKLVLHKEVGTLWVRDRVNVVNRISDFLNQINGKLNRPVYIQGIITEVELADSDSFGIDWQLVRENVALNLMNANLPVAESINSTFSTIQNSGGVISGSANPVQTFATGAGVLSLNNRDGGGNVTNAFVDVLRKFGDVRVVSRPSLSVNNGSVGSLLVGNTISYVSQAYTSSTSSSSVTNSVIVKPLQTGVSFYVLPHIISDEEALIYVSPELSSLQSLRSIKNGNNTVEAPSLSMKQAQTVISVKNGESVVIGGLMSEASSANKSGVNGLSEVPGVGTLFRSDKRTKNLSEFSLIMEVSW